MPGRDRNEGEGLRLGGGGQSSGSFPGLTPRWAGQKASQRRLNAPSQGRFSPRTVGSAGFRTCLADRGCI